MDISIVYDTADIEERITDKKLIDTIIAKAIKKKWEIIKFGSDNEKIWKDIHNKSSFNNTISNELIKESGPTL